MTVQHFETKAEAHEFFQKKFPKLMMHTATVTGGKKIPEGQVVDCIFVGANKWYRQTSLVVHKGKQVWMDPAHLKAGKEIPADRKSLYESEREARSEATLMVVCDVLEEREKAVKVRHPDWAKAQFFPKSTIEFAGYIERGDHTYQCYHIDQFILDKNINKAGVEALEAEQAAVAKELAKSNK